MLYQDILYMFQFNFMGDYTAFIGAIIVAGIIQSLYYGVVSHYCENYVHPKYLDPLPFDP